MSVTTNVPSVQTAMITSVVALATILGLYLYQKNKRGKIPTVWKPVATIKKIWLYPIKSGNNKELARADCTVVGIQQTKEDEQTYQLKDRALVVYGENNNEFKSAKTYPKLLAIDVSVHGVDYLALDAPNMRTLYIQLPSSNSNKLNVSFWYKEQIKALDCGDEAAKWISRYVLDTESGLRIGFNDGRFRRNINKTHQSWLSYYKKLDNSATGTFQDITSINIISQKSVNDMNTRIENTNTTPRNFRPNLVIDGDNLIPYEEEKWDYIKVGDQVIFRNVKECTRCLLTTMSPVSGERNKNRQPLKALESYHLSEGPDRVGVMGIHGAILQTGRIHVGDTVYVGVSEGN